MGGITDKITGKVKQAAGDITNDGALRREGLKEERKGEAKDELAKADKLLASIKTKWKDLQKIAEAQTDRRRWELLAAKRWRELDSPSLSAP